MMASSDTPVLRTHPFGGRLLASAERRRLLELNNADGGDRATLGQFFTSAPVAALLASLFTVRETPLRVLDAGAGVGGLTAAFADHALGHGHHDISVTAVEVDRRLGPYLNETIDEVRRAGLDAEVILTDYVEWAAEQIGSLGGSSRAFDCVIMNPPYFKLGSQSRHRATLKSLGIEASNMYAAFLMLAARQLVEGGELVAITPRSFANGSYFRRFRRSFMSMMSFDHIHMFESRSSVFSDVDVLQENVVFRATKGFKGASTYVTMSESGAIEPTTQLTVPTSEVVVPGDSDAVLHLPADGIDLTISRQMRRLTTSLRSLGLTVSTGQIVAFRLPASQTAGIAEDGAPFLHQSNLTSGGKIVWPASRTRHPQAIAVNRETRDLLMPMGHYVVTRRFTAKEERRRLVAAVVEPERLTGSAIGFENHLNVIHRNGEPIDRRLACGIAAFLNSTIADRFFRQWSGHTQVNATDLRLFPFPTAGQLNQLGDAVRDREASSHDLDDLLETIVDELVPRKAEMEAVMAFKRIGEARDILSALGMPPAQSNDRSALTLLALVDVRPRTPWRAASAPLRGITPIMEFIGEHYGRQYAPNTRETIRRHTIHQFLAAGLVERNPDAPSRPVNSPQTVYRATAGLVALLQVYKTEDWGDALDAWRASTPSLLETWGREREMRRIPVTLPNGEEVTLSPGGQNSLIRAIVEEFCSRFVPGGQVLYVGDAEEKFAIWEGSALESAGVRPDPHGKMPDVIVRDASRDWLIVIEAVTSHGPVDSKRRQELAEIFRETALGVLYVSAFVSRAALSEFISEISWETDVWLEDSPTHLIHFDGERFLGPYE